MIRAHTAGADEQIEEDVGDRTDQGEVAAPLPDQLVAGGVGDRGFQRRAHAHGAAVGDEAGDRLPQRQELGHGHPGILTRPIGRP